MEIATDSTLVHNAVADSLKPESAAIKPDVSDNSHQSNGDVGAPNNSVATDLATGVPQSENLIQNDSEIVEREVNQVDSISVSTECSVNKSDETVTPIDSVATPNIDQEKKSSEEENTELVNNDTEKGSPMDQLLVEVNSVEELDENVSFQTEIIIEEHVKDETVVTEHESTENILNELGQNIEFNEVLVTTNTTENIENNNGSLRQEVFNKEQLIDILEGNDKSHNVRELLENSPNSRLLETQLALTQLSSLKKKRKRNRLSNVKKGQSNKEKRGKVKQLPINKGVENDTKPEISSELIEQTEEMGCDVETSDIKKDESNIVNVLVKDWDDDGPELDNSDVLNENNTDDMEGKNDENTSQEMGNNTLEKHNQDSAKSGDEGQPQRRLGRVIKKKVIFDPDNPDTFTKSKATKTKELPVEKDQSPAKKNVVIKNENQEKVQAKSPVTPTDWKKPLKHSKQNRRPTEIDKLLMDEGAVNMIYQLTPEATKGKRNIRTKAEFIKKLQSSTNEGKEMKFRERKKECKEIKIEDGGNVPSKISSIKQRMSLSSSVKSPSVCEDFETHSADDSIIYRRHSSSSFSSSGMSPRRLSDVDSTISSRQSLIPNASGSNEQSLDIFTTGEHDSSVPIIKSDCITLKQKISNKLSLALNKRKSNSVKCEKAPKQKKMSKTSEKLLIRNEGIGYKYLTVNFEERLAEICIKKTECTLDVLKELEEALLYVDSKSGISVTLLISECGTLCSDLDLSPLIDDNLQKRTKSALAMAEAARSLLSTVKQHSKLLCSTVWGSCSGVAVALVALSDVALASEQAEFSMTDAGTLLQPGAAVLTTSCYLSKSLVTDLVVLGRRVASPEAARGGLLARSLWPRGCDAQARAAAAELARLPPQNIILKKNLLNLKSKIDLDTFLTALERERDLLMQYWSSSEGQELLNSFYGTPDVSANF